MRSLKVEKSTKKFNNLMKHEKNPVDMDIIL